jgi:hypothetical protein
MSSEIDQSLLPPLAKRLVADLGLDHALVIIRAYKGRHLFVPHTPTPELLAKLGAETAQALCRHYGGELFRHVPRCLPALLAARNRAIVAAVEAGTSKTALIEVHDISYRQIHNICQGRTNGHDATPPTESPQADLFSL